MDLPTNILSVYLSLSGNANIYIGMNQIPLDTHSSPDVSQAPNAFAGSNQNKAGGNLLGTVDSGSMANNVDAIYAKKDVPSPDEVACGYKYELNNMTAKDKAKAKELVMANLRKDPHHYSKLNHLNIDDKTMQMNETKKIIEGLVTSRARKFDVLPGIGNILDGMREGNRQFAIWKKNNPR